MCDLHPVCSKAAGLTCRCSCVGRGHGTERLYKVVSAVPEERAAAREWTRTALGGGGNPHPDAYSPRRIPKAGPETKLGPGRRASIRHGRGVDEALAVAVNIAIDAFDQLAVEVALAELIRTRISTEQVAQVIAGVAEVGVTDADIATVRARQVTHVHGMLQPGSAGTVSREGIVTALANDNLGCAANEFAKAITDEMIALGQIQFEAADNPGHVWCGILAALCKALDEIEKYTTAALKDAIKDGIAGAAIIVRPYPQRRRTVADRLLDFIIDVTAGKLAKAITAAITAGLGLPNVKLILRVAGAVCCRDPDEHPAVFKYCVWPIVKPILTQQISATGTTIIHDNVIGGWQGRRPTNEARGTNYWDLHV